jgi:hypothetical protein
MNRPLPQSAQAAKAKLLGFQLANPSGCIIQGDDDDPLALMSFQIMSPAYAVKAVEKLGDSLRYLLMPIYEGDVEDPHVLNFDLQEIAQ